MSVWHSNQTRASTVEAGWERAEARANFFGIAPKIDCELNICSFLAQPNRTKADTGEKRAARPWSFGRAARPRRTDQRRRCGARVSLITRGSHSPSYASQAKHPRSCRSQCAKWSSFVARSRYTLLPRSARTFRCDATYFCSSYSSSARIATPPVPAPGAARPGSAPV